MRCMLPWCLLILLPGVVLSDDFAHFEGRHAHPLDIIPNEQRLLAVNTLEGRLSVFTISNPAVPNPMLIAEIPVGLEPVTVRARNDSEAWVVNELSDSVSVVDLTRNVVVRTIQVPDEPADVVFTGNHAFISCGRANRIAVINLTTFAEVASIPLIGNFPRSLAINADGTKLFVAFLLSGNNTTTLHFRKAPPQPEPSNPELPEPPQVGLIVPDTDPRISYDVIDHDVAEIDAATFQVIRYHEGLGTNIFALATGANGTLWAAVSEARNLIRFEPNLNGMFAESRLARLSFENSVELTQAFDLNSHASAAVLPAEAKSLSLAQPMALLADVQANTLWLAAFGSDRIAELNAAGSVLRRIDLRSTASAEKVRGPRGLARSSSTNRIYVLNKLSDSISVVDLAASEVLGEIAISSHDPMPAAQRMGRGFFFDSRRSGNGTVSCGACHFDADNDGVAWDLGNPNGEMQVLTGQNLSLNEPQPIDRPVHPMKGPMVTQSLRGIKGAGPFHWRGDKQTIQEFNPSFSNLQAGSQLTGAEMDNVALYLNSLRNQPNPNRNLDNTLKPMVAGGNPAVGSQRFHQLNTCSKCHSGLRGTNHVIDEFTSVLTRQPVKNATLEHVYRKIFFTPGQPESLSGFGFTHDGSGFDFPRGHEYDQDRFRLYPNAEADVMAFILSTETDTAPAVGCSVTMSAGQPAPLEMRVLLEGQALAGNCELVIRGMCQGRPTNYWFNPATLLYQTESATEAARTFDSILNQLASGDAITLLGVPPTAGMRYSVDRNLDGKGNADEPLPTTTLTRNDISTGILSLSWSSKSPQWYLQESTNMNDWKPFHSVIHQDAGLFSTTQIEPSGPAHFFRLSRSW